MTPLVKIPGLSTAAGQVIAHFLAVFLLAFGTQLVAGTTGTVHISSLLALLTSAAAAGIIAVAHVVLGLVPSPAAAERRAWQPTRFTAVGVSLKVRTDGYQFLTSVVVMFVSILGAQLASGALHITSLPDVVAVVLAAIAAAVTGVVQFVIGLVPAPH